MGRPSTTPKVLSKQIPPKHLTVNKLSLTRGERHRRLVPAETLHQTLLENEASTERRPVLFMGANQHLYTLPNLS
jgi:hypothetical protein